MQFRLWRAAAFVSSPIHLFDACSLTENASAGDESLASSDNILVATKRLDCKVNRIEVQIIQWPVIWFD